MIESHGGRTVALATPVDDHPAPASVSRSPRYVAVDGLRGIAILSVLFYHAGITERGLFGVDAFFTISGFFVTLLLLRELSRTNRVRIGSFYGRRARRILPGVLLVLAVTVLLVARYGTADELERGKQMAVASVLQVANWHQLASGGTYWEATGGIDAFGQLWSLSVTEQFYLVWPLVLLAVWRLTRGHTYLLIGTVTLLTATSAFVAPLLFDGSNVDRLYMGTDARAVAFLAGALAATAVSAVERRETTRRTSRLSGRVAVTASSIALLAVLVIASAAVESYREPWLYKGGFAFVALVAAALVATLCSPANALTKPLSNAILAAIGRIAYLLFLLHLPVYWLLQVQTGNTLSGWKLFLIGTTITLVTAMIIHGLFTEPLRLRSWSRTSGLTTSLSGCAAVIVLALAIPFMPASTPPPPDLDTYARVEPRPDGSLPRVVTVGDSIAVDFANALEAHADDQVTVTDTSYGGCGILDPESARTSVGWVQSPEVIQEVCAAWQPKLHEQLAQGDVDFILVHTAWDAAEQKVDGAWIRPCDDAWQQRHQAKMDDLFATIRDSGSSTQVLLANDRIDSIVVDNEDQMECYNQAIERAAGEHGAGLLDWNGYICPDGVPCRTTNRDGSPLYRDGLHLSDDAGPYVAAWLTNELANVQPERN